MRPLYTKFSLVFLFFLLLHSNTPSAMMFSFDKELLPTKDRNKETSNPIKPRTEVGGKADRAITTKPKRKVLPISSTTLSEEAKTPSTTPSLLTSKSVKPLAPTPDKVLAPDPFYFTISSDKDSVSVGEEVELTIKVNWVDYGVNNGVKFLPEWYKYNLKVVMPKGFIQTGGDYTDYCTKPVDANNQEATFTIKGKFEFTPEDPKFTVLRGFEGADDKSSFISKGEKLIKINNRNDRINNSRNSRVNDYIDSRLIVMLESTLDKTEYCDENEEITLTFKLENKSSIDLRNARAYFHYELDKQGPPFIKTGCISTQADLTKYLNTKTSKEKSCSDPVNLAKTEKKEFAIKSTLRILRFIAGKATNDGYPWTNDIDLVDDDGNYSCVFGNVSIPAFTDLSKAPVATAVGRVLTATGCAPNAVITWNNGAGTGSPVTVSPTATTKYKATCTKNSCTSAESNEVTVTVSCTATQPSFDTPTNNCDGTKQLKISNSTYLSSTQAYQWQYSSTAPTSTTNWANENGATGQTLDADKRGYYRVKTTKTGCSDAFSVATAEIILPTVIAPPAATTPVNYRVGATAVALEATASPSTNTLIWYDAQEIVITRPTPSTASTGDTYYYVSQTDGTCTSLKTKITVSVTSCRSDATTLSGTTSGCSSVALSYSTTANHTYQWQKKNGNNWDNVTVSTSPNGTVITGTITSSGTYRIEATKSGEGCSAYSNEVTVTIAGVTTAVPTDIGGNVSQSCNGSITLTTSGCSTYYWTVNGVGEANTDDNLTVTVPTSGAAISVYCGNSGCYNTTGKSTTVTVARISTPTLSAKDGKTNLQGGTIKLQTTGCNVGSLKWYKGTSEIFPTTEDEGKTALFSNATDIGRYKVGCGCDARSNEIELINSSLCGNQTGPTYKQNGVAVSEITGYSGTTVEIEATCANGGAFSWSGSNQPTLKNGNIYNVSIPGTYTAQCFSSGCNLDNELKATASNCNASEPTFSYSPSQSVASGTEVSIMGACTVGSFSWSDGTSGDTRRIIATPTNRSFEAKCTVSSGCFNAGSADINVGCNAPTPNFTSSVSFPVREGDSFTVTGNCDGGSYFRWSDGAAGSQKTLTAVNDLTVGGSCISNTISNCSASNTFDITVLKRTPLTLTLITKNAVCPPGDNCTGRITATIGNRENNNRFAYWIYQQQPNGSWAAVSYYSPANITQTSQADWNDNYYFGRLRPGKYQVVVRDYYYAGNDPRDEAVATVDVELTVCPNGDNYKLTANKFCLDRTTNPNDFVRLDVTGCTGTIEWWRDNASTSGGALTNFNNLQVTVPGRYKALCTSSQEGCGIAENSGAFSNGIEITEPGKQYPLIVGINNQKQENKAPDLYYDAPTYDAYGVRTGSVSRSIYWEATTTGGTQVVSSIYQLLGKGIAFFQYNNQLGNINIPAASTLNYSLGESVTLMAAGCGVTSSYYWSNGLIGQTITFTPTDNTPIVVTCKNGDCISKPSNSIVPNRTSGKFTFTSDGNTVCPDKPVANLSATGCENNLTVKWFRQQIITPAVPAEEIGTGKNLALSGTLAPTFTAKYWAECYSGTKKLLDTLDSKPIRVTLGSELTVTKLLLEGRELNIADPDLAISPCKNDAVNLEVKGCVGKVRWAKNLPYSGSSYEQDDQGNSYPIIKVVGHEITDIEGKTGTPYFSTRFTAKDTLFYACAGVNPTNKQYICSTPWNKIIINTREKSNAKPENTEYVICEGNPLTLRVVDHESTDKLYIWKYLDTFNNAFEFDFRPKSETINGTTISYTIADPVVIPKALPQHSAKWKLEVVNACGSALKDTKIGVTQYQTSVNFIYSGSYKNMTFKNATNVAFKRYKLKDPDPNAPRDYNYYAGYAFEKVNTDAVWTIRNVNSPAGDPPLHTYTQTLLTTDTDWAAFNYSFDNPGMYEVSVTVKDPQTSCDITKRELVEAKCDQPAKPTKPANADKYVCLGTTPPVTFTANGCTGAGYDIKWYSVNPDDPSADVTSIFTGATLSLPMSNFREAGTNKYRTKCHYGVCTSDFSEIYTLTLGSTTTITSNAIDPVTSVPSSTAVTVIENRSVTLSTTGCEYGIVTWYKTGGSTLRTGNPIALTKSDVNNVTGTAFGFYAKCTTGQSPNTCTSPNSNTISVTFTAAPPVIPLSQSTYSGCESVTLNVPVGSGDGIYRWYQDNSAYVKGSGSSFTIYESGRYRYESAGNSSSWVTVNITKLKPRIENGPIIINGTPNELKAIDDAAVSGDPTTQYRWKRLANGTQPEFDFAQNNLFPTTFNPNTYPSAANPVGIGKYELVVIKGTTCTSSVLKTEVYPNTCAVAFTAAITCDPLAKITVNVTTTGTKEYRLDMGDWQTTNVFADVPYGKHTVSVRVTNGSQICYGVQVFNEDAFDACGKLNCDGIVIVAKDNANNETNTIPRGANKTLQTLNLSAASLDGADLSKGVTYLWERMQVNTTGGQFTAFSSTQAAVSIGVPGRYTLKMVRGTTTCTTQIAINAKPCTETPDPTGAIACTTPALTAVADEAANRLTNLAPGDVVRCGDFNITIIEATGNANGWNGKGYVKIPYLNAEVSIILRNAVFNDCYQLTNANATAELPTVYTEYDPKWGNVVDLDKLESEILRLYDDIKDLLNNYNTASQKDLQAKIDRLNELKGQVNNNPNFSSTFKTDLIKVADNAIDAGTCTKNTTPSTVRIASSERVLDCTVVLNEKESYISKYYKLSIIASNLQPSGGTLPADVASLSYFTLTRMVDKFPLIPSSEIKPVVEFVDAAGNTVKRLSGYFVGDNRYASYSDSGDADLFFVNGRWYYRKFDLGLESLYYYEPTTRKWINFVPADFPTENFYDVMRDYGPGLAAFADRWEKVVVGVCGVFLGAPVLQFGRWGLTYYLANQGLQVGMTAFRDDFKAKFGPTIMAKYDLIQVSLILTSIYQIALSNNVVKIGNDNITTQITTANNYIRTQIPAINNAIAAVEAKIASTPTLFANYRDKIDNVLIKIKTWISNSGSIFNKNTVNTINGFSDNIENLVTNQGITISDFKRIQQEAFTNLTTTEKALINILRNNIANPDPNTILQKVIPKSDIANYLNGTYKTVGGFMTTAKDAKHLSTFDDIYHGMRLDYDGTKFFLVDKSCGVIRFKSSLAGTLTVPKSIANGGVETSLMPFTGHGFTSGRFGRLGVPEWKSPQYLTPDDGAELWEVDSRGLEVLKAKYSTSQNKFVSVQ